MTSRLTILFILEQVLSVSGMGVALFWAAGRLDWWPAWAAIAIWIVWYAVTDTVLFRVSPSLVTERLNPPKGAKIWDRAILSAVRLLQLARYIVAGLDYRYGWTGGFPLGVQMIGLALCVASYSLLAWAMASNAFFSQVVRVQTDRGQTVVTGGPYRLVRHPGYLGAVAFEPGMSVLLGSWWAVALGVICSLLFVVRTELEDRSLRAELPGYADYAERVRFRLFPGIW